MLGNIPKKHSHKHQKKYFLSPNLVQSGGIKLRGPKLTLEPRNVLILDDGDESIDVHFDCDSKGEPQPQYTWRQGNKTITSKLGNRLVPKSFQSNVS